jgi:PAS domain S-box-containing protein
VAEGRRVSYLVLIMVVVTVVSAGVIVVMLYRTAIDGQRERLVETAQSQARLIEAMARHDAIFEQATPGGPEAATLSQIIDAHDHYVGFGETGEFTLARIEDDDIVFLLSHRHEDLEVPSPIPFDSELAEPMRQALLGRSGSIIALDYRGVEVLAAHEPVAVLNLGIVAKIDMTEVRAPFLGAGLAGGGTALVVVLLGTVVFLRVSDPIVRRLREHSEQLEQRVDERTRELRIARDELEQVFNLSIDMICIADMPMGRFVRINPAFEKTLGLSAEELLSRPFVDFVHPDDREKTLAELSRMMTQGGPALNFENRYRCKDGSYKWLAWNAYPSREQGLAFAVARDITARRWMEQKLRTTEKLAALGELAGGVGHELRNPLGAIKNASYFLNMTLDQSDPEVQETLGILEREVATAEGIITSLLDYARARPPMRRKVNVNEIVRQALSRVDIPQSISVVDELDSSMPPVMADPAQLLQVFTNIALNAVQAMPGGGHLTLHTEARGDDWTAVSFTDDGVGIAPEDRDKLFEPLFTRRAKGIGLGLSITRILVEGHGGSVEVASAVGRGSKFTVLLPAGAGEIVGRGEEGQRVAGG